MKQIILSYIKHRENVSYAELSRDIEGFTGDYEDQLKQNLVLWSGVSLDASIALAELIKERQIFLSPASPLVYFIDGCVPGLPVAKRVQEYKKRHWLPVTFSTSKINQRRFPASS